MKKKILGVTLAGIMALGLGTPNEVLANNYDYDVKVKVNGEIIEFLDAKPFIDLDAGRTYIPLRSVGEALQAQVDWVDDHAEIVQDNTQIKMWPGNSVVKVNTEDVKIDAPVLLIDGKRTMVPLRFISEVLGEKVDFFDDEGIVLISGKDNETYDAKNTTKTDTNKNVGIRKMEQYGSNGNYTNYPIDFTTDLPIDIVFNNLRAELSDFYSWGDIRELEDFVLNVYINKINSNDSVIIGEMRVNAKYSQNGMVYLSISGNEGMTYGE